MRTHTSAISLSIILFYIAIIKKTAIAISMNRTNGAVDGEQRMTSVEIAELTGKNHFDVLRAIRKMEPAWEKITECKFAVSEYKDSTGRTLPCYSLTKTECPTEIKEKRHFSSLNRNFALSLHHLWMTGSIF